jgi:NADPH-dependent 2,4-dienoyl-CoA reductase/sulfur reductase-like enzyme
MRFFQQSSAVALSLLISSVLSESASPDANPRDYFLREILAQSNYPNHPTRATPNGAPLKVGILGAGAAGLYAAIMLDSLGIDYDILEASDRAGGRIFTYRFNETAWAASTPADPAYYDYYVRSEKQVR